MAILETVKAFILENGEIVALAIGLLILLAVAIFLRGKGEKSKPQETATSE